MPTAVKIWEIVEETLQPVADDSLANNRLEAQLEKWVAEGDASILGDRVLVIARQKTIPGVGRLDLLGIDQNGTLIIIELKRDSAPREAVAQALDYASWLHSADAVQIEEWAEQHLNRPLKEKFCEYFDAEEFPELSCQKHRILLVASRLDASAERIITYLSEQFGVEINAIFFQYARLSSGKEILARAMLVTESVTQPPSSNRQPKVDDLVKMATERGNKPLVESCRAVGALWFEEAVSTFGGSFRYWGRSRAGQDRMVFGVNVAAKANTPRGQLDVWIPAPSIAEVTGRSENDVRAVLRTQPTASIHMGRNDPCWIRLKTVEEAQSLVEQLRGFTSLH
jgi:hypothetical protein